MDLTTPISQLTRVGKTTAKKLERLGIKNVRDLLFHLPFRYEDFRKLVRIVDLKEGENVTICGQVELIANKRSFRKRKNITEALVSDKSGSVRIVWFNQPFLLKIIKSGDVLYLSGKVKRDMLGPQLISPIFEKYKKQTVHTGRLVPVYPLTYGLTQKQTRFLISQAEPAINFVEDWMPAELLGEESLMSLQNALKEIHFPKDEESSKKAMKRFKFDELFILQMKALIARQERQAQKAPAIVFKEREIKNFVASLPFKLTRAQKVAAWEILQDCAKTTPMNRLLSGDVGSGKTAVAAMAIRNAAANGLQSALMAPTEILAIQHYNSLVKLFEGLGISVGLLTGNQAKNFQFPISNFQSISNSKISKRQLVHKINEGEIKIIVGTHALLSEGVDFKNLGLVIVDEQHRFGVQQRKKIKEKGAGAHFLSMTATPIPRSLALVLYGELDLSTIGELPPGRIKIISRLVEPENRGKAYQFMREQAKKGRQAFVICPLIEKKSEEELQIADDKKTVISEHEKLSKAIFPDLRVSYLHGKMKPKEKDETMRKFRNGEIDILVSTSVVEVGIDIPNAGVMMIEGAENFGLAQLHQFRGRVGRSRHQSYCLLFANSDSPDVLKRLKFFEQTSDGFKLAEKDLEIRGPGEVYGTEQSGILDLKFARITDAEIIKKARGLARKVFGNLSDYPRIMEKASDWERTLHLE